MADERREWVLVRAEGLGEAHVGVGKAPLGIGRSPENEIVLADSFASARHVELVDYKGKRCVRDLGSTNGTLLNGEVLTPGTLRALADGDVIRIGTSDVIYRRGPRTNGVAGAVGLPASRDQARGRARVATQEEALGRPRPAGQGLRRVWARLARLALLVAVVVGVAAGVAWLLAPPRVSLLVMGSDARPDELRRGDVGRTDTLLTVVADRTPAGALMISIPRDLWVEIPGFGSERINAAYAVGGPTAAERTVGSVLGVPVDRHLLIGLQGVRDVVDAAGGVEIDVERPIHDDTYPTDDYGTIVVDIPAGRQHMDGETALRYARSRHQDSDFGRVARQQRVMLALRNAMLKPTNWWRIPAVIGAMRQATQTDLGLPDLVTLAFVFGSGSTEPDRLPVDLGLVEEFRGGDGAYLLRARPALKQRVAAALNPSSASVEVLNGSGTTGLATQAADTLRSREMRVVHVGNAARVQPETSIEVRPGLKRAGLHAASMLGVSRDVVGEGAALPEGVDIRVTLGEARTGR